MSNLHIKTIIHRFTDILQSDPWYGTAVYDVLDDFPASLVHKRTKPGAHAPIDILYHMITWTEFTLRRMENNNEGEPRFSEKKDWRDIDPKVHTWKKGVAELKRLQKQVIAILKKKDDSFLRQKVDYRDYDVEYLLNGIADHHIYHLGQIALLRNIL